MAGILDAAADFSCFAAAGRWNLNTPSCVVFFKLEANPQETKYDQLGEEIISGNFLPIQTSSSKFKWPN